MVSGSCYFLSPKTNILHACNKLKAMKVMTAQHDVGINEMDYGWKVIT